MGEKYPVAKIEKKWQNRWEKTGLYEVDLDRAKKPFYNLMMFPYPSAEGLHVGNMYAFTGADIYGRFKRMQGFDVFQPIGLDGFGIHSENYALKIGAHPMELSKKTEKRFYQQLHQIGNGFCWKSKLETYDPSYYKWTQWIFIQMFKNGLAIRKKAPVNWCPHCLTVLSDEQVIAGRCERCKTEVVQKETEQWFFKITKYAERLLKNLEWIDWSERVKVIQKNWIGRSEGAELKFPILNTRYQIPTFTTRPDTIFGATFLVLSPQSEWVEKLTTQEYKQKVREYIEKAKKKTKLQRFLLEKEKTGVFTGSYVINPATEEKIPVWVADYVVKEYGTGAVMGVPAHDQRDYEFAKKYNLPIRQVIEGGNLEKEAYEGEGRLINSGKFSGLRSEVGREKIVSYLAKKGLAKKTIRYKLRDWCISRQRYWGPPIPMIKCPNCGWVPVPEKDLPVLLPYVKDYRPKGKGVSPLAQLKDWVKVRCPKCGGWAERETDVSDTFLDSAWYFFRYPSVDFEDKIFDPKRTKKWLPVDIYIGGAEHAVLHLMYTRFLTMVFKDLGLIDFEEPFKRFFAHGLIIKDGAKMSKSRGNVVVPDDYIKKYGADTLRMYLMFLGPFEKGGDFRDEGIEGMYRFLQRVWRLVNQKPKAGEERKAEQKMMHRTIKKVTEDISTLNYNTAIARIMEYVNFLGKEKEVSKKALEVLVLLLAPFAPHLCEELWEILGNEYSVHKQSWPKYEPRLAKEEEIVFVVQVNGKVRERIILPSGSKKEEVLEKALASEKVKKYIGERKVKRTVFVKDRLVNFVV